MNFKQLEELTRLTTKSSLDPLKIDIKKFKKFRCLR